MNKNNDGMEHMREKIIAGVLAGGVVLGHSATAQAQEKASVGYYPGALISMPVLVASEQKFF